MTRGYSGKETEPRPRRQTFAALLGRCGNAPDLNGTDAFAEMTAHIAAISSRTGSALLTRPHGYEGCCIMTLQSVFFARDNWLADHGDWQPRIQGGKTVDVSRGDGQRIFAECLARTADLAPEAQPLVDDLRRYGTPQTVQPRLGQGTFRIVVTNAYGACAVSGEHPLPALEAAHVRPYTAGGDKRTPANDIVKARELARDLRQEGA